MEMFEKLAKTQPVGPMGEPEEIAHLELYLCSDDPSLITGDYPMTRFCKIERLKKIV